MIGWLRRVFGGRRLDADLDRELQFHVDTRTQELMQDGLPRPEARRRALAEFGGMAPMREATRDARGTRWLADLWQDLRYTRRVLGLCLDLAREASARTLRPNRFGVARM